MNARPLDWMSWWVVQDIPVFDATVAGTKRLVVQPFVQQMTEWCGELRYINRDINQPEDPRFGVRAVGSLCVVFDRCNVRPDTTPTSKAAALLLADQLNNRVTQQ